MDWLSPIRGIFEFMVPVLDSVPAVRAILGFVLVFIVPGFTWTLVFFEWHQVNIVERLALSLGLSIALVALAVLVLHIVLDVGITGFNAVLIILTITAIAVIIYFLKRLVRRHRETQPD